MPIVANGQFNPASLGASGFYVSIVNPPSWVRAVPTDVIGLIGTASWGPVNKPQLIGAGTDAVLTFGPVGSAALIDPYDLATDLNLAFLQANSQASLQAWGVRVTDGTDTAATTALAGVASATPATITVAGTITAGDTVTPTATSSVLTGSPIALGPYTVKSSDTTASIAVAIAGLINANATLSAAGVSAVAAASVVSIYWPASLSPTIVWSAPKTGTTETYTVGTGTASTTGATLTAIYTGIGGNAVKCVIANGTASNTYTVTLLPPYGGVSEVYPNLSGTNFWGVLKNALNNGMSPARPASKIATIPGLANNGVGVPTTGTFTLAGGTDGRTAVTTATLLGSDTAMPRTGLYSLRNLTPAVSIAWIVGMTDNTILTNLVAFGQSAACKVLWCFPSGTNTQTAITNLQTYGVADSSLDALLYWDYIFDQNNNQQRLVPPYAIYGGMWATYAPQNSPDNKPVYGVIGSERNNPQTGSQPFTLTEIGNLQAAGIAVIANPIPAGSMWGVRGGRSTSADPATQPAEYWRMTTYLARSLETYGGKYVGQLQSQQATDPLRRRIKAELNAFFQFLEDNGQIDAYRVLCEFTQSGSAGFGYNNPTSVSQHYLYAMAQVTYLSSVWYFIMSLQGGTTVNVQVQNSAPLAA